jgi:hypothetical protein
LKLEDRYDILSILGLENVDGFHYEHFEIIFILFRFSKTISEKKSSNPL